MFVGNDGCAAEVCKLNLWDLCRGHRMRDYHKLSPIVTDGWLSCYRIEFIKWQKHNHMGSLDMGIYWIEYGLFLVRFFFLCACVFMGLTFAYAAVPMQMWAEIQLGICAGWLLCWLLRFSWMSLVNAIIFLSILLKLTVEHMQTVLWLTSWWGLPEQDLLFPKVCFSCVCSRKALCRPWLCDLLLMQISCRSAL